MSSAPHEQIDIAKLLFAGGLVESPAKGRAAIVHGRVYIERWNIGVSEATLPRWVLRGVMITVGDHSMKITDDGAKIQRVAARELS